MDFTRDLNLILSLAKNGQESLSFAQQSMVDAGWRGLGNSSEFATMCVNYGFVVRYWDSRGKNRKEYGKIGAASVVRYTTVEKGQV